MNFDFLRSATASSSAYRVVCGEMIIDSNMSNVHNEVLVAVVRDGYMTVEMGADTYSLSTGDIYFISPNQRYKINSAESDQRSCNRQLHSLCKGYERRLPL